MSDMRERFEEWCIARWAGRHDLLVVRADGEYVVGPVQFAWAAFQANQPTWQPIETAPSGQEILVTNGKAVWIDWKSEGTFWQQQDDPTHWMPLPEPPNGSAK